jgi:hypothetical protein
MTRVQSPTESFGRLISHIDNAGQMVHDNNAAASPFLNCKVLDVNMPGVRCGLSFVDHSDGRNVILAYNGVGLSCGMPNSSNTARKYLASLAACTAAINSASVELVAGRKQDQSPNDV